jgi:myo-inositol-1(or 4)-monophosphatase
MIHNKFSRIASDFRRFGSAVLEICTIAAGRAEVYCELKLMPWDHAAAGLILTEAGGKISTVDGKNVDYVGPTSVLASNNKEDYLKYIS